MSVSSQPKQEVKLFDYRCGCRQKALLGKYGDGYWHIKYRQEVDVQIAGPAKLRIRCWYCHRVHTIRLIPGRTLTPEQPGV